MARKCDSSAASCLWHPKNCHGVDDLADAVIQMRAEEVDHLVAARVSHVVGIEKQRVLLGVELIVRRTQVRRGNMRNSGIPDIRIYLRPSSGAFLSAPSPEEPAHPNAAQIANKARTHSNAK